MSLLSRVEELVRSEDLMYKDLVGRIFDSNLNSSSMLSVLEGFFSALSYMYV